MIRIGDEIAAIPTPALIVDLVVLERNLVRMSALAASSETRLRPHAKAHKSPDVAAMQIARGAAGICCQTVREAEGFAAAGIPDILLTNQVADCEKADRLARLARTTTIGVCVDSLHHVALLAAAARAHEVCIDVYIEAEVGGNRCGVPSPAVAVALASAVSKTRELGFAGLQVYNGRTQHLREAHARRSAICETALRTRPFLDALHSAGLPCERITGGGTGSAQADVDLGWLSELQCGTYALMDADYVGLSCADGRTLGETFAPALFVVTSVISTPAHDRAVVDAGLKALAFDSGPPQVLEPGNLVYRNASDEHGVVTAPHDVELPGLSSRLWLVPGHCDPTVALHAQMYAVKEGRIAAIWPVIGRGEW